MTLTDAILNAIPLGFRFVEWVTILHSITLLMVSTSL